MESERLLSAIEKKNKNKKKRERQLIKNFSALKLGLNSMDSI